METLSTQCGHRIRDMQRTENELNLDKQYQESGYTFPTVDLQTIGLGRACQEIFPDKMPQGKAQAFSTLIIAE
jgi:hypothetical protein